MPSITFRHKSGKYVGTIDMEGQVLTCREIQEAVAAKLSAPPEEIRVFMADSTDLLHPKEDIPAYAVVDVVRQVSSGPSFAPRPPGPGPGLPKRARWEDLEAPASRLELRSQSLTEEERLAQLQAEVGVDTGVVDLGERGRRGRGGPTNPLPSSEGHWKEDHFKPPPRGYICHNCGKGGHYIQHCPSAKGGKYMRMLSLPVGIPESMLVECAMDDPAPKFITRDHRLVKRRVDASAFSEVTFISTGSGGESTKVVEDSEGDPAAGGDMEPKTPGSTHQADTTSSADAPAVEGSSRDPIDQGNQLSRKLAAYKCIVDGRVSVESMKVPCCKHLLCKSCFDKMVEDAFAETVDVVDGDGLSCPHCHEPLILDDVVRATEEETVISELLKIF
ncbi:unnamed protein product [Phytomonas sp. Hart1]|nr:unnamed protein product [Phytomonas sp. Hart1]|eukprot:CCW69482.1 unnamed protein product [Phytomonas sp. isolate Hart1]